MAAPKEIFDLVGRFENSHESHNDVYYNETQVRREFVDHQFFSADQVVRAKEEDYEC